MNEKGNETGRSFYPTPSTNQPFDLDLGDFLSPAQNSSSSVQNVKLKPALDSETETALIETAMREHNNMMQ